MPWVRVVLRDKLRQIKNLKSLFGQIYLKWAGPDQKWLGAGERLFYGEKVEAKQGNYLIGYSVKPDWLFGMGGP